MMKKKMEILIFGTGSVSELLLDEINDNVTIVAFVNSDVNVKFFHGYKVIQPAEIEKYKYDYIIVASGYYIQIEKILLSMGILRGKIVGFIFDEGQSYQELGNSIEEYLDKRYNRNIMEKVLKTKKLYPHFYGSVLWKNNGLESIEKDFVREQLMMLMAKEIERKNVPGAVAELGVFRGDFTVVINKVLPGRCLYLFDTFCGFGESDVLNDKNVENKDNELRKFRDTSEEYVISRLNIQDGKCVVKKGWFPETFDLYDEKFCFVSIDMNMYFPVTKALELFMPRVCEGGYVLISDFNAPFYEGTRQAIIDFCDKQEINFLPVPDLYGSVVICK